MWKGKNVVSFFSSFFLLLYCLWKKRIISSLFPVRTPSLEQEVRTTTRWPQRLDQAKPKRRQVQKHLLKAPSECDQIGQAPCLTHPGGAFEDSGQSHTSEKRQNKKLKEGTFLWSFTDVEKEFSADNQELSPLHKKAVTLTIFQPHIPAHSCCPQANAISLIIQIWTLTRTRLKNLRSQIWMSSG